jgi:predicted AAA+ superfamily ATPase
VIGEILYVPELFRYIKMEIDEKHVVGRFLLTGSQQLQLSTLSSESLAGRVGIVTVPTLTVEETSPEGRSIQELTELIRRGGYPEVTAEKRNPAEWFPSYINTYLERDIRTLTQIGNLADFARLLRAIALRSAGIVLWSDLARDIGIAPNTAKNWVSLLETSGVVVLVEGWSRSRTTRIVKAPKLYFTDTGLLCSLLGFSQNGTIRESPLFGMIWENYCFCQIWKYLVLRGLWNRNLFYWRTKEGLEVDFILEQGEGITAFECKAKEIPTPDDARGVNAFCRMAKPGTRVRRVFLCGTLKPVQNAWGLDAALNDGTSLETILG